MKIKSSRNFRRIKERNEKELTRYLGMFIEDCKQHEKSKWKELYTRYEKMWMNYANKINSLNPDITIFTDGFESCMLDGWNLIQDRSDKKVMEILYHFKEKTWFEKVRDYLKDYYGKAFSK